MRPSLAPLALAATLAIAAPARASDDEVVTTKGGAVYRGQLVEKVPGDHVLLKMATGELRRFPWSEVATSAPADAAAPARVPGGPTGPRLVLEADDPQTSLFALSEAGSVEGVVGGRGYAGGFESWRSACVAPCGAVMDPRLTYRIAGIGITPSSPFVLPQGRDEVRLRVHAGNAFLHGMGKSFAWTGLSVAIVGGIVTAFSFAIQEARAGETDVRGALRTGGLVAIGVGGGLAVLGLPIALATGTSVQASTGESLARGADPTARF